MTISLRLNEEESSSIKKYADLSKVSVSEFMRESALERIEDEYDLEAYHEAMVAWKENQVTYSLDEVEKGLIQVVCKTMTPVRIRLSPLKSKSGKSVRLSRFCFMHKLNALSVQV